MDPPPINVGWERPPPINALVNRMMNPLGLTRNNQANGHTRHCTRVVILTLSLTLILTLTLPLTWTLMLTLILRCVM